MGQRCERQCNEPQEPLSKGGTNASRVVHVIAFSLRGSAATKPFPEQASITADPHRSQKRLRRQEWWITHDCQEKTMAPAV
jgi:hypothetical protein